jgi:hypothetical protein
LAASSEQQTLLGHIGNATLFVNHATLKLHIPDLSQSNR